MRLPRIPEADSCILTVDNQLVARFELGDGCSCHYWPHGLRIGEALAPRRRHLNVTDGRTLIAGCERATPGGRAVIDTP